MTFNPAPYCGIRFVDGGRDSSGCDCWGLVRLALAERGIDVPTYGEISATDLLRISDEVQKGIGSAVWQPVEVPQAFDVVVMHSRSGGKRRPSHCGIMVDARRMLHIEANTDSVIVPIDHASVRFRIFGFFRHRDLA